MEDFALLSQREQTVWDCFQGSWEQLDTAADLWKEHIAVDSQKEHIVADSWMEHIAADQAYLGQEQTAGSMELNN